MQIKAEIESNELKLASLAYLEVKKDPPQCGKEILAEFMPMPGSIPVPTPAHCTYVTKCWGGRFKTPNIEEKVNVLNLFDVAISLRDAAEKNE